MVWNTSGDYPTTLTGDELARGPDSCRTSDNANLWPKPRESWAGAREKSCAIFVYLFGHVGHGFLKQFRRAGIW